MCTHESSMHAHTRNIRMHAHFLDSGTSFLRAQNIIFLCGPAPKPLETSKDH